MNILLDNTNIVRCKDCEHRGESACPMWYEEYIEWDDDGYLDHDWIVHDATIDDGFCDRGVKNG